MNRLHFAFLSLAATLAVAPAALGHEAAKGHNGGLRVESSKHHLELVGNGTPTGALFPSDKPIPAAGFKANAILVIDGKSQRFELAPTEGSKLTGTAPAAVTPGTKGAIQITAPDGTTAQAKY